MSSDRTDRLTVVMVRSMFPPDAILRAHDQVYGRQHRNMNDHCHASGKRIHHGECLVIGHEKKLRSGYHPAFRYGRGIVWLQYQHSRAKLTQDDGALRLEYTCNTRLASVVLNLIFGAGRKVRYTTPPA